ncbi:hypothetical protein M3194_13460 [Paenibacillus glycanilyticus]|uniref:hypothetical protein n=1 Tax=Paenibacillus glycanilyticus TaxID=126569 RepID=UPI00203B51B9|nr:hypothetical protein [Paenibacillus glycanilyticus]MCM3628374.1 hypothetical protein [Paenibacillus glycanilyticus]
MLQIRYYYFLLYLNFIVCMIEFTPKLIYSGRYTGSLSSLMLALFVTCLMIILFERQMNRFSGQSIAQIMSGTLARFVQKSLFLCYFVLTYGAGLIFLISYTQIIHRFICPDMSSGLLFAVFLVLVLFASLLASKSILFMLEIIVIFQIPFMMIMILLFLLDSNIQVDFLLEAATYIRHWPAYQMIAAGAFLFNGYMSRLVFNEHLVSSKPKKQLPVVFIIGLLLLLAYYFIPIGYLGLAGIDSDNDVWFTATNSMRLPHFFIERYLVVFLMIQLGVSLMFVIVCCHSSLQFLKQANLLNGGKIKWIWVSLLLVLSCALWPYMGESAIRNSFFSWFLNVKLVFDILMVLAVLCCARRIKPA